MTLKTLQEIALAYEIAYVLVKYVTLKGKIPITATDDFIGTLFKRIKNKGQPKNNVFSVEKWRLSKRPYMLG